ncbi:hypothetical protein JMA_22110 [Jeotgalibacillus malaysiensis]|uniref:Uncharacterized protein n=1 Tax=Jeotgalibacillus malaysiensis TaxID=1508404 RepID=A0A0B5ASJ0_9BACL|nr:hypothetical protein [Jeotgalibacillus malaysiensis]AJD91528.1 hypothetical protein JMA_22110 [Jeotgalibacillus malaysiensis]
MNKGVDANVVIEKLTMKIGEKECQIAVLEAMVDKLMDEKETQPAE